MAREAFEAFVFENGKLAPYPAEWDGELEWSDYLQRQGYSQNERVWGYFPDMYVRVYEAERNAPAEFPYVAVMNLVQEPRRVFLRDMNDLIAFLRLVLPLLAHYRPPEGNLGDALSGTQGADN